MIIRKLFNAGGIFQKLAVKYLCIKENGSWCSETLRELYAERKNITVGWGSYGWQSGNIDGPAVIGKYCSFAPGVRRYAVNHPTHGITTHPCWFNPSYGWIDLDWRQRSQIVIGNDVWIGANVVITPAVRSIGNGAIIAAGAVVTKDVPPYEIWGGVPASKIEVRFSKEICDKLQAVKWWDMDEDALRNYLPLFKDPELFIDAMLNGKSNMG